MTCALRVVGGQSHEATGPSVEVLGIQWSGAGWDISSKGKSLYLVPPSKTSTVYGRFLWVLEGAYTAFGWIGLIHFWGCQWTAFGLGGSVEGLCRRSRLWCREAASWDH